MIEYISLFLPFSSVELFLFYYFLFIFIFSPMVKGMFVCLLCFLSSIRNPPPFSLTINSNGSKSEKL